VVALVCGYYIFLTCSLCARIYFSLHSGSKEPGSVVVICMC
jgi:hypothetical protein